MDRPSRRRATATEGREAMTDVVVIGAGAAGLMCAIVAGQNGRSVRRTGTRRADRVENPDLGWGTVQFHQHQRGAGKLSLLQPRLLQVGAGPLSTGRLSSRSWRSTESPTTRKKLGQLFLRSQLARNRRDVATRMRRGRGEDRDQGRGQRQSGKTKRMEALRSNLRSEHSRRSGSSSRRAVSRCRNSCATDFAYRIARQFGLNVIPGRPGLVPFTFGGEMLEFCQGRSAAFRRPVQCE